MAYADWCRVRVVLSAVCGAKRRTPRSTPRLLHRPVYAELMCQRYSSCGTLLCMGFFKSFRRWLDDAHNQSPSISNLSGGRKTL